jgi:hypothetical protein
MKFFQTDAEKNNCCPAERRDQKKTIAICIAAEFARRGYDVMLVGSDAPLRNGRSQAI